MGIYNQVNLVGYIIQNLEIYRAPNKSPYLLFRFAICDEFVYQDGKQRYINIFADCFGQKAENIVKYYKVGDLVSIRGKLHTDPYVKSDGYTTWVTKVEIEYITPYKEPPPPPVEWLSKPDAKMRAQQAERAAKEAEENKDKQTDDDYWFD